MRLNSTEKQRRKPLTLEEAMRLKAQRMREVHEHFKKLEADELNNRRSQQFEA